MDQSSLSTLSDRPVRVAIMTDEKGWHTGRLKRALRARGCEGRNVDLAECRFDTTVARHGLVIPGFGRDLPDAAIVRGIANGTLEQVTKRLGILHALRELGIPVYNDARAIERSVDKSMTTFLLHAAGIATPATWTAESTAHARRIVMREEAAGRSVVMKPLFGSEGKGLHRVGHVAGAHVPLPDAVDSRGVVYLQRFIAPVSSPGFDYRVLVVGGKAVAAMRRVSGHWIHNVAQGARCEAAELTSSLAARSIAAASALGLDYAGVDLLPLSATGDDAVVIEVNGVAAWRGLQSVTHIDIAQTIVDDLLARRLGVLRERSFARRAR